MSKKEVYTYLEIPEKIYDRLYYLASQNGIMGIDGKPCVSDLLIDLAEGNLKIINYEDYEMLKTFKVIY